MIFNLTQQTVVCDREEFARTFWQRLRGLLGRTELAPGEGLVIGPCNSIHTFGMKFPIDVLFLTGKGQVVAAFESVRRGKIIPFVKDASLVLELPAGIIRESRTTAGDLLLFQNRNIM